MKVDTEEVKRHLEILGYTDIEPNLLDAFVKDINHNLDLRKLIEYDQKHNITTLSSTLNRDWDQSYSEMMKTSTFNKNSTDCNQISSTNKQEFDIKKKQKHQISTCQTSKVIDQHNNSTLRKRNSISESELKQNKCYLCGNKSMENQSKGKMKHNSNTPTTIYIDVTFNIEL